MKIVTLCTGNAARSVMLGFMLETLARRTDLGWLVRTAGTHATEGQAMSVRTLTALQRLGDLDQQSFTQHRSHQLTTEDVVWADVVLAAEADHVVACRQNYPLSRDRVVQLALVVRSDGSDDVRSAIRTASLLEPNADDDVVDPAGGDQAAYDRCAERLWALAQQFAALVTRSAHH